MLPTWCRQHWGTRTSKTPEADMQPRTRSEIYAIDLVSSLWRFGSAEADLSGASSMHLCLFFSFFSLPITIIYNSQCSVEPRAWTPPKGLTRLG